MENIPEEEDENHEFYGGITENLSRIRSSLEGDTLQRMIPSYNPQQKPKTTITKVDGDYVINK